MRILVCGGRNFTDFAKVDSVLEQIIFDGDSEPIEPTHIITGGARGADFLAQRFALGCRIPHTVYPAQWEMYGKSAGYRRNIQMLEEGKPDLVVAFPGGKGTAMMIDIAKKAGVEVMEIE